MVQNLFDKFMNSILVFYIYFRINTRKGHSHLEEIRSGVWPSYSLNRINDHFKGTFDNTRNK